MRNSIFSKMFLGQKESEIEENLRNMIKNDVKLQEVIKKLADEIDKPFEELNKKNNKSNFYVKNEENLEIMEEETDNNINYKNERESFKGEENILNKLNSKEQVSYSNF